MSISSLADVEAWEKVPLQQRLRGSNVYDALDRTAAEFADKPAIHWLPNGTADDDVTTYSYRDFIRRVRQTANLFHSLGLQPGDVVSMLLPVCPEAFFCLWGAETAFVANPINPFLETRHIVGILREAGAKLLIGCDPAMAPGIWDKVSAVRAAMPELVATIRIGGSNGLTAPPVIDYDAVIDGQPGDRLLMPQTTDPAAVAALFHTGGTTGLPKLAQHTHLGAVTQGLATSFVTDPSPDNVVLNGLPPFHVGGAMCAGMAPLTNGQTVVLLSPGGMRNPAVVRDYWRIAERFKATVLGAVPTSWAALLNVPADGVDLSSVRFGLTGGSGLPIEVGRAIEERLGMRIIEGYGMTELHGYVAMTPPGAPTRFGSTGVRMPYCELMIAEVAADGSVLRRCETGEIGAVLWRGPLVFKGYLNPNHGKGVLVDGWLNSGDLGRLDADGYIWLTGRAKDLIIRGGHNIDPLLIEEALYQHPAVETVAAVGRPDRYAGEIPVAFVQLKPGVPVTADALKGFARDRIAERAAAPVEVFLVDTMPATAVGKIFKPALRYRAAETTFTRELAPLAQKSIAVTVEVGPHDLYGTLATVRLGGAPGVDKAAVTAQVAELLGGYQLRHQVAWT